MTISKLTDTIKSSDGILKINEIIDALNSSTYYSYSTVSPELTPINGICTWVVTHNLGSNNIICSLYINGVEVEKNVQVDSTNQITLSFNSGNVLAAEACRVVVMSNGTGNTIGGLDASGYLPPNTIITVGRAQDDFLTLQEAFSYLQNKWSSGKICVAINSDLVINDELEINCMNFNFPIIELLGNNHTITLNFSESGTYTCGLRIVNTNYFMLTQINFVGGTNGATHILSGGYNSSQVFYYQCSFTDAYAGVIAYQGSRVLVQQCTCLTLQVGVQAQQSGTLYSNQNTYGDSTHKCVSCCDVYHGGFVFDSEANRVNYTNIARQGANAFKTDGLVIAS